MLSGFLSPALCLFFFFFGLIRPISAIANITDDGYFYGQSPPVYPSPPMPGGTAWAAAYGKAVELVSQMTLEERANITVGYTTLTGCSGETGSVPRLNWPGLCLSDAGNGLRNTEFVSSWPSGIHVGASWNRNLALQRGLHMGAEFKTKGVHVALGPVVGPLGRIYEGGRNWEGISNDPYLCGQLAAESITGVQSAGVTTSIKHYIGNEQETNRNPSGDVASSSSNIDDKTVHELYLWPFADAVHAGAGCVMCSYNRLNNSYACQNSKSLNGLLKTELGFEGFVVSDWNAQHTGLASAEAGLDLTMPDSEFWGVSGGNLTIAVNNGSLPESRVTDMATRIVASWYQMGQDEGFPKGGIGMPLDFTVPHEPIYARDPASKPILLQGALEGHVLVKNINGALPLKAPKLLSIFGYDAVAPPLFDVPLASEFFGPFTSGYEPQLEYRAFVSTPPYPGIAFNGTMIVGGGSGANTPPYYSAPIDALQEQAYEDGTSILWDFASGHPAVDTVSDACLVFLNAWASESYDRPGLRDDFSDALVQNVAANCSNTIVVIHNAGPRLVDQWIDNPNVTALIFAHLPGQDSGRALVQLLYGAQSPSGKLPYTVAKNESDYNTLSPVLPADEFQLFPQDNFTEGLFIDYRYFDAQNVTPRYEFGFGLTYTTFEYSDLAVHHLDGVSTDYFPPSSPVIQGGIASLWDVVATIKATITNTGSADAAEVAQLYVGIPGGPVRQLRGFSKVDIPVGGNVTVSFDLLRRDLSEWNVSEQSWVLQQASYQIFVGSSSRDLPLVGTLSIG